MNPETLSLPPSASSASNSPTASTAAAGASAPSASGGTPMAGSKDTKDTKEPPETKGWLYKWTNYIKGYQKRWFVLANGLLSYYRNQAEMAHTCRGTISLHGAHIHTEDSCNFIVSNGGGTQTFHLRASSEVERQRWVTALELAKAKAIQRMESEDDESSGGILGGSGLSHDLDDDRGQEIDKIELINIVKLLGSKLEDLQTCHDLIVKHGLALQRSLGELDAGAVGTGNQSANQAPEMRTNSRSSVSSDSLDLGSKQKAVNERATLFKITSNAMINASAEFLDLCQGNGRKWQKVLSFEREQRQRLEDMVEQLAKQHSHLENMVKREIIEHEHTTADSNSISASNSEHRNNSAGPNSTHSSNTVSGGGNGGGGSGGGSAAGGGGGGEAAEGGAVSSGGVDHAGAGHAGTRAKSPTSGTTSDDDELFEDARDDNDIYFHIPVPPTHRRTSSEESQAFNYRSESSRDHDDMTESDDENKNETYNVVQRKVQKGNNGGKTNFSLTGNGDPAMTVTEASSSNGTCLQPKRTRRSRIPDKPNISFSLWSIMKNCIGKDLSRIPVPVNFSEPLSMLQRMSEDLQYSEILDKAAQCQDDCEQLAYVAAFTVSAFGSTAIRTGKPFNPLLGETFELDRSEDMGFKLISEQVSHHPPMLAQHCENVHGNWKTWQEFTMRSKFKGKYLEVEPLGITHLEFPKTGNHYTWRKVKTIVHNIVIGKLWIDQVGEMEVINHRTGDKCHLKYEPYSYFAGVAKKVHGTVMNKDDKVEWVVNGTWDSKFEGAKVLGESKGKGRSTSLEVGPSRLLWKVQPIEPEAEKYYNFSILACELNELEEGVAPTDCRLRPDQRFMEEGEWDMANTEKVRLEEKQRGVRKKRESEAEQAALAGEPFENYQPTWFKRVEDEQNGGKLIYVYKGGYWENSDKQDWSMCPDIY